MQHAWHHGRLALRCPELVRFRCGVKMAHLWETLAAPKETFGQALAPAEGSVRGIPSRSPPV